MPPPARVSWAADATASQGRLYPEADSRTRTPFARDRDRVIHCTAFRRLKEKTQVFVAHEGDYYRTRLTHSLEVAQIARSLAKAMGLDDDLAEGVALAHDLGHPPFGHAGEDELHKNMEPFGGFDHNVQTFRVVTELEERYPRFLGLNLSWETLEGVIKHNGPVDQKLGEPAWASVVAYNARQDLRLNTFASAEAQVAAISDDIAYNNHDVDDGLQAGLFTVADLMQVPLIGPVLIQCRDELPDVDDRMLRLEAVRRLIGVMIDDVIAETGRRVDAMSIRTPEDVRLAGKHLVQFSAATLESLGRLRAFLYERMYRHYRVNRTRSQAKRIVSELFALFMREPEVLPTEWFDKAQGGGFDRARAVCDYIAGMTDRYAIEEHKRLFRLEVGHEV